MKRAFGLHFTFFLLFVCPVLELSMHALFVRRSLSSLALIACSLWSGQELYGMSVNRDVLPNGLTVVTVDRRDTHAVHMLALVEAGLIHEQRLLGSGISRLTQAMILANSRRYRNEVSRLGGQVSGLTHDEGRSASHVGFSLSTTDTAYEEGLQLLGKLLTQPELGDKEWKQAHSLLDAKDTTVLRDIESQAKERLKSLTFRKHPSRIPHRGLSAERKALTLEEVTDFYENNYSANKTTIIVVGNVDHKRVVSEVNQAFADMKRVEYDGATEANEPVQFAQRQAVAVSPDDEEYQMFGWRTPPATFYKDHAALDLLQHIIQDRLQKRLASDQEGQPLATAIQVRSEVAGTSPGVFSIAFKPGQTSKNDAWFGIQEVLDDLRQNGPSADELQASKRNWQRKQTLTLTKVGGIASDLARWEQSVGVPGFGITYREAVGALTLESVKRVVASHLHPKGANLSMVNIRPAPTTENDTTQGNEDGPKERSTLTDVAPKQELLPFGAKLLHRYMPIGLAHVRLTMKAGSSIEQDEFLGVSQLLAELLQAGSVNRRGADFQALLKQFGMEFTVQSSPHHLELHLICFPEDVPQAMALLVDLVKQPAIPETALEQVVARLSGAMGPQDESWLGTLKRAINQAMLSNHYSLVDTTRLRESLAEMDREKLLGWFAQISTGSNLVFSVYGEYEPTATAEQLATLLNADPQPNVGEIPATIPSEPLAEQPPELTTLSNEAGADEAFALVWEGPAREALGSDGPAMDIFNALLLGNEGRGGRLANVLGDLGIDPENALKLVQKSYVGRGYWAVAIQVPAGRLVEVNDAVKNEIALLVRSLTSSTPEHQEALNAEEVSAAQALSKNARTLAYEDQGDASLLHAIAVLSDNGLTEVLSYQAQLSAVTRGDLARIANRYFAQEPITFQLANPIEEPIETPSDEASPEGDDPAPPATEKTTPPPADPEEAVAPQETPNDTTPDE